MELARREEFERAADHVTRVFSEFYQVSFGHYHGPDSWSPPINLYRVGDRWEVCVDLAGVDRDHIDVTVEPGQLTIRGVRPSPEPVREEGEAMRIVTMEIDHGRFCRVVPLPEQADLQGVESYYEDGLLWIKLPLRKQG